MADLKGEAASLPEEPDSLGDYHHIEAGSIVMDLDVAPLWDNFNPLGMEDLKLKIQTVLTICAAYLKFPDRGFEVSLTLVNNARMQELNETWRAQNKPTNVLSFPAHEKTDVLAALQAPSQNIPLLLGDIIMARETVDDEAKAQNKNPIDHFIHLLVHGFLHLCGHDHVDDLEAEMMEKIETSILAEMNIAPPYAQDEQA